MRHQPLTAGLVDGTTPVLDDDDLQAGPRGVRGGDQARRPASGHQQINHDKDRKASFSTRIRVRSNSALATENTSPR